MCGLRGIFRRLHFPLRTGLNQLIDHLHFRVRILARRDRDRSGRLVLFECDAIDAQGHLAHIQIAARGKVLADGLGQPGNLDCRRRLGGHCRRGLCCQRLRKYEFDDLQIRRVLLIGLETGQQGQQQEGAWNGSGQQGGTAWIDPNLPRPSLSTSPKNEQIQKYENMNNYEQCKHENYE